MSNEFKR